MFQRAQRGSSAVAQLVVTIFALLFALPFIVIVTTSLRGQGWKNYQAALQLPLLPQFFFNSTVVAACTIVLVTTIALLAAYAFAKLQFWGKEPIFYAILAGLFLPSIVLIVPLFQVIKTLHLFDNYLALILPYTALTLPFTLLLMRNFFDNLPNELLEAARIDGCNSLTALWYIVLPLSRAILIVVVLWTFLASWNEYFLALIFMRSETMQMVTQAPQYFVGVYGEDVGKVFASLLIISLPLIIAYIALQRYFEQGLTAGAVK